MGSITPVLILWRDQAVNGFPELLSDRNKALVKVRAEYETKIGSLYSEFGVSSCRLIDLPLAPTTFHCENKWMWVYWLQQLTNFLPQVRRIDCLRAQSRFS